MLNLRHLETMIITADAGSFRRAADRMYITPSAVIKQIDALEEEIGAVLFERTSRGLSLTAAGHSLYTDGKLLLEYADKSIARARNTIADEDNVLRVGTSPVTSADLITNLWSLIYDEWPQLKIQIIPFQNTPEKTKELFAGLGREIDMITGVCDQIHYAYRNCSGTPLQNVRVNIAVPMRHPYSRRLYLEPSNLNGQDILILSEGKMEAMNQIRRYLKEEVRDARIHDFDFFGMDVFNECENNGFLLITTENWVRAHPMLRLVEMKWDFAVQYGILHAADPSRKVRRFLSLIAKQ